MNFFKKICKCNFKLDKWFFYDLRRSFILIFYNFNYSKFNTLFNRANLVMLRNTNEFSEKKDTTTLYRKKSLFFLLSKSPWPIFSAFSVFLFLFGLAGYLNFFYSAIFCVLIGLTLVLLSFLNWLDDLTMELTFLKRYSLLIRHNLRFGFWIFIVTEVLLFASFFWAFFNSSLEPSIQIATLWPPLESIQCNRIWIPFANTVFLLSSGAALTWLQYSLLASQSVEVYTASFFLFTYAFLFLFYQYTEYVEAFHQVNDGIFGSTMYMLTSFHGAHVVIGVIMLFVSLIRFYRGHFKPLSTLGFTLAGWYWHFVDVVWILVFSWIYLWGTWIPSPTTDDLGSLVDSGSIGAFVHAMCPEVIFDDQRLVSKLTDWILSL